MKNIRQIDIKIITLPIPRPPNPITSSIQSVSTPTGVITPAETIEILASPTNEVNLVLCNRTVCILAVPLLSDVEDIGFELEAGIATFAVLGVSSDRVFLKVAELEMTRGTDELDHGVGGRPAATVGERGVGVRHC